MAMHYLLIPDKFKDSLTAKEVIEAITKGIERADPVAKINSVIASDGGDGFLEAIANNINSEKFLVKTVDPLARPIEAPYLYQAATKSAYIELAKASGLELLKESERSALKTSTYGTGLQMLDAIKNGATTIYVGLGGSATNDAGIGIAAAFGYTFLDKNGKALEPIGENLTKIATIENNTTDDALKNISIYAVNDVTNPLFGTNGAAYVYAQQKGATEKEIKILDDGLQNLNSIIEKQWSIHNSTVSGAGAAGGTAFGLKTFLNANFVGGIDFLLDLAQVSNILEKNKIDYIITGEGKIDSQTANGKLVKGVIQMAKKYNIPVIGICGKLAITSDEVLTMGLQNAFEIYDPKQGVAYSMQNARKLVENTIFEFFKT